MTRYVQHIEDHLDKGTFPARDVHLKSRFGQDTLLVYWELESQYTEYTMTIEEYFQVASVRKVTFDDFRKVTHR